MVNENGLLPYTNDHLVSNQGFSVKELTRAEEQVMRYLWKIRSGFLKDIIEQYPEPKPAYTTVSTVIRVLVKKGFISYRTYGKTHEYYPLISRDRYFKNHFKTLVKNYFSDSPQRFVSFYTEKVNLDVEELEEMIVIIKKQIRKKKAEAN
jgi:predicted transcriptional regulator